MEHGEIINPSASKQAAMASLDWCVRNRQVSLLNTVLNAHFSHGVSSDLEVECSLVLRQAVKSGCQDTLTSLLRHVDDSFLQQPQEKSDDRRGRTRLDKCLGLAVDCGHRGVAEVLLKKGADANMWYRGEPLLHLSLSLGHPHMASLLMDHRANVNVTNDKGETPLFAAVSSNKEMDDIINKLIDRGADVHHRSATGRRPIHSAVLTSNSVQSLIKLAQVGCDVSVKDDILGDTPLHLACARYNREAVMALIQHGADLNSINHQGQTPLRKLLQHTTRVNRDFQHHSRMKLAQVLVMLGFRLLPRPSLSGTTVRCSENLFHDQNMDKISSSLSRHHHQMSPSYGQNAFFHSCLEKNPIRENGSSSDSSQTILTKSEEDANGFSSSRTSDNMDHVHTCSAFPRRKANGTRSHGDFVGRDKVFELFQSLLRERPKSRKRKGIGGVETGIVPVPALQHLCRLQIRGLLPKARFQESVGSLEVSPQLRQYLMFLPDVLDDTLGYWRGEESSL